jgi:hypothetical protein
MPEVHTQKERLAGCSVGHDLFGQTGRPRGRVEFIG